MFFSVYKPGQGYWTRVLTAIGAGVLVLASVSWLWSELDGARFHVNREHVANLGSNTITDDPLSNLGIYLPDSNDSADPEAQGVRVQRIDSQSPAKSAGMVSDDRIILVNQQPVTDPTTLISALTGLSANTPIQVTFVRAQSIVLYVQAAVAIVLIAVFGLILWGMLNKPRTVDFMIATEAEMKKVNWPSRQEIIGSTLVVVCGTAFLMVVLFLIDLVFGWLFIEINILDSASP